MRLALQVQEQYHGSSSDPLYRLTQGVIGHSRNSSESSEQSLSSPSHSQPSTRDEAPAKNGLEEKATEAASDDELQTTVITFLASLDENAPGSLRRSGAINRRNDARQTLLHIATVMGFHRLVRRLIFIGAHLDLQDMNGYTALGLSSLSGQLTCARVLIEAGASYDRPTAFGEMPLDLAKAGDNREVEALLLSAVWSTEPERSLDSARSRSLEDDSEIDNDNPSSGSDDDVSRALRNRKTWKSRAKQKARMPSLPASPHRSRRPSFATTQPTPVALTTPKDDPPPYDAPVDAASWMSRKLSNIPHSPGLLPGAVWDRLPIASIFGPDKEGDHRWVAFPCPTWETLQKMASPEEVKLFTQAMAAAAFNAIAQSGATTSSSPRRSSRSLSQDAEEPRSQRRGSGHKTKRKSESPAGKVVRHVKRGSYLPVLWSVDSDEILGDRMLYLFWLPILLFVGFWLMVSALPLATGFCLIYARQITRYIKQRM